MKHWALHLLLLGSILMQLFLPSTAWLAGEGSPLVHTMLHEQAQHMQQPLPDQEDQGHLPDTPFCPSVSMAVVALPAATPAPLLALIATPASQHLPLRTLGCILPGWRVSVWHPPSA